MQKEKKNAVEMFSDYSIMKELVKATTKKIIKNLICIYVRLK
jgi:hypothetical protein